MNSNLDAKLVGAIQSEIDLRRVSFPGKELPEIQSSKLLCAFTPLGDVGRFRGRGQRTTWSLILSVCIDPHNFSSNGEKSIQKEYLLHPVTRERSFG
jgi:hypothetical protein